MREVLLRTTFCEKWHDPAHAWRLQRVVRSKPAPTGAAAEPPHSEDSSARMSKSVQSRLIAAGNSLRESSKAAGREARKRW